MKITITGSLGNISKPLARELVQKGHSVTVISSKSEKQKDIEALGATAAIGSIEDVKFLTATFTGADAVYCMVPPANFFDHNLDLMADWRGIGNNYAQAIQQSGVKRVVHLSSIGAHLDKGTGLILGHHYVEGILNNLSNVAITYIRPAAFYYNLFGFIAAIKRTGIIASNYGGEDKGVWVSPTDIAAAIAEEIVTPLVRRKVRYVASDELTCNEVASILGAAIGKPDLKWIIITIGDQLEPEQIGPVPSNAIIVKRAPQLELLKLASVCITHSGVNTVLESLAQGVPQVAIPVTFDQPGIAARIAYHETGVVTSLDKLSATHLSTLLGEVLSDPTYRENACRIQKAIAKTNWLSAAADLIEHSLGVPTKTRPRRQMELVNVRGGEKAVR